MPDNPTVFTTPLSDVLNQLLWGDLSKGEAGVLVRMFDVMNMADVWKHIYEDPDLPPAPPPDAKLQYLPASHLHASMRAKRGMFVETYKMFGFLIGTKYRANYKAMADFQQQRSVDAITYYPIDSATMHRGVLMDPHGQVACEEGGRTLSLCVEGKCLAKNTSACGPCQILPAEFGELVSADTSSRGEKVDGLNYFSCYYDEYRDMIEASNSLWENRGGWFDDSNWWQYRGHTECLATANVADSDMADALVLPLLGDYDTEEEPKLDPNWDDGIGKSLQGAHKLGHTKDLPILLYRETKGMSPQECLRMWNDEGCDTGYRKEFVSQEFTFFDNSCLHRPVGCDEVYYFPPSTTAKDEWGAAVCTAFTEESLPRREKLCANERKTAAHQAWYARAKAKVERSSPASSAMQPLQQLILSDVAFLSVYETASTCILICCAAWVVGRLTKRMM